MKNFCVTYDLIGNQDYDGINEILKTLRGKHILGSVWTFQTNNDKWNCKVLYDKILNLLNEYDIKLYVAEVMAWCDNLDE